MAPDKRIVVSEFQDVAVASDVSLTPRYLFYKVLRFRADQAGAWLINVGSGEVVAVRYGVEVKVKGK
jgi:hypothetical protein